ncbi:TMEM175 family protein [Georgenia sp. AZ-5]|uniref:TMEM175 family protein n=1 Tax=Georgenia sp. AZ-5 TaxID=3367526 RepID=UPI0037548DF0
MAREHGEARPERMGPAAGAAARTRAKLLERETSEFDRGLFFFDAIYAVAITLLVHNVDVPLPEEWLDPGTLVRAGVLHQLGGFALSFVVIAAFWRMNVHLVKRISAMDPAVTAANLLAAAFVVLIPFTTQAMSDPRTASYTLPTVVYAVNLALASLAQLAMFEVARRRWLEVEPMTRRQNTAYVLDALTTPVTFAASVPVALAWGANAGRLTWAALLVIGPVSGRLARRAAR